MAIADEGEGTVTLADGKKYVLAPLTLGQLKRAKVLIPVIETGDEGVEDAAVEFIGGALKRHHPDLTAAQILDLIELRAVPGLIRAIMATAIPPSDDPSGEAKAGQG